MSAIAIMLTLIFSIAISIIEVPEMLNEKLYKELLTFSILLGIGTVLAILKSLDISVPGPSGLIIWIYSPFKSFMQSLMK